MAIVVVQSDEFAAWIGVAGVVVGVVLTTGIEALRSRRAEQKRLHADLLRAGLEVATGTLAQVAAEEAAGHATNDAAWVEVIQARKLAVTAAYLTIHSSGDPDLDQLSLQLMNAAAKAGRRQASPEETQGYHEALHAYSAAVRAAKL